jgi:hypothetical protein
VTAKRGSQSRQARLLLARERLLVAAARVRLRLVLRRTQRRLLRRRLRLLLLHVRAAIAARLHH